MANNSVSFDSDDVNAIVSFINDGGTSIDELTTILSNSFSPLIDAGLFTDGLNKIISKINSIKEDYVSISSAVQVQSSNYDEAENAISNYGEDYMSYYSSGSGGSSHRKHKKDHDEEEIKIDDVSFGKEVDSKTLDDVIEKISDKTLVKCINFLNVNKSDDIPFNVFLDEDNKDILATYIREFYHEKKGLDNITIEDSSKIREIFLEKILNTDVSIPKAVKEDSLIKYKTYLTSIANDNKTDLNSLITDVKYSNVINTTLTKLYNGEVESGSKLSEKAISSFKTLVEERASLNKMKVEDILKKPELLI